MVGERDWESPKNARRWWRMASDNGGNRLSAARCRRSLSVQRAFEDFIGRERREKNGGRKYTGYGSSGVLETAKVNGVWENGVFFGFY